MKIKNLLSIDYNSFISFVNIVVQIICILLFSLFIIFDVTTEKYGKTSLFSLILITSILLIIFLLLLIIRLNKIKNILDHGIIENMEIIDSVNWPKDKYVCILHFNGMNIQTNLKVSKKNKLKLDEYCKKGNIVSVGYLENKLKNIILIDLYKNAIK